MLEGNYRGQTRVCITLLLLMEEAGSWGRRKQVS